MAKKNHPVQQAANSEIRGINSTPKISIRPDYKIEDEQIINQLPEEFAAE